jgi:hypothetical protein
MIENLSIMSDINLLTEEARRIFSMGSGTELGFDLKSLQWVEDKINQVRPGLPDFGKLNISEMLGYFLGETLIRQCGGQWKEMNGDLTVYINKDLICLPFVKAAKFLEYGKEDSVVGFFLFAKSSSRFNI